MIQFKDLIGKTLTEIRGEKGSEEMVFTCQDGNKFRLVHHQDCCENVAIEDICGELHDLIGVPILQAEESTSGDNPPGVRPPESAEESFTWTFYRISTIKGQVVIRWYGASNGYYSESVDFEKINP
jgi:hypothetical protein